MSLGYALCASPFYISRYGESTLLGELSSHHCITGTDPATGDWSFKGPDGATEVAVFGRLQVNNATLRRDAAWAGAGDFSIQAPES
jgi:hypothetical protein